MSETTDRWKMAKSNDDQSDWQAELDALADLIRRSEEKGKVETLPPESEADIVEPRFEGPRRRRPPLVEVIDDGESQLAGMEHDRFDTSDAPQAAGLSANDLSDLTAVVEHKVDVLSARLDTTWVGIGDDIAKLTDEVMALRDQVDTLESRTKSLPGRRFSFFSMIAVAAIAGGLLFAGLGGTQQPLGDSIAELKDGTAAPSGVAPVAETQAWSFDKAMAVAGEYVQNAQVALTTFWSDVTGGAEESDPAGTLPQSETPNDTGNEIGADDAGPE
ncbi:MAG: hypothetical protein AAGC83_03000 [Pseudomonadota bacterium]